MGTDLGPPTMRGVMLGNEETWKLLCQPFVLVSPTKFRQAHSSVCLFQFLGISETFGDAKKDLQNLCRCTQD